MTPSHINGGHVLSKQEIKVVVEELLCIQINMHLLLEDTLHNMQQIVHFFQK